METQHLNYKTVSQFEIIFKIVDKKVKKKTICY